jgi:SNF2 family DNA or RNA helicase
MNNFATLLQLAGFDPKPHQEEGVKWALNNELEGNTAGAVCVRGGLLADEMGLGKTIQMLGIVVANPRPRTLIVMPRALLEQWYDSIVSSLHHCPVVFHASRTKTLSLEDVESAPIVITTYGNISTSKTRPVDKSLLHQIVWDRVIFDEAHHLRNRKTAAHIGAVNLKAAIRWLVTGTPIQNSMTDFYGLCGAMGIPESYFKQRTNLLPIARQFMLKRTKIGVGLELPELRTTVVSTSWDNSAEFELSEDIHSLLEFSNSQKSMEDNKITGFNHQGKLALLVRARQACIYPPLLSDSVDKLIDAGILDDSTELRQALHSSSKIDTVVSTIFVRKNNGRNKLIFCHYRGEIDRIRTDLQSGGLHVETFDGRTPSVKRNEILNARCDVLILQIKTGCEGLNLQHFSEVYFISPHWNPAVEDQAVARCHRIGQEQEIDVFRFKSVSDSMKPFRTLDEYSCDKQTQKRVLMNEIIS